MFDRLLLTLPGIRKAFTLLTALAIFRACIVIGQIWSLSSAITNVWYGNPLSDQLVWLALFLVCFIGRQLVLYAQRSYLDSYAYRRADEMRQDLLSKVFAVGAKIVQQQGSGNITTTILEGIEQIETYLRLILSKMIDFLIIPPILLVFAFTIDWVSALVMIIVIPFIIIYMIILGHTAKDRAAKQHQGFALMSNHFIDSLRGIDTLKLFGKSKEYGEDIFEVSETYRVATMKTLRVAFLSSVALDLFTTFSIAATAILLGLRLVDGTMPLFPALTILIMIPEYFRPIRDFASDYHASLDGKNALNSVSKLIDFPEDFPPSKTLDSWDQDSCLKVDGLEFSYPDHHALKNVSLEARGYQSIGIVGTSGAGKSTLIQVIGGFDIPQAGSVSIQGQAVKSFKQSDWQKQVIYIPQHPYIFHASLRENIVFYHPSATDDEVAKAIEIVGLESFIEELPQGLQTKIGEGARALSGGQAQRIALARAFLDTSRKILLFDEPTAHLDIETEMELKERMLPLMQDRLVFFATHRMHWMNNMDSIVVLKDGNTVEQGTLSELRSRDGVFSHLVSHMERGEA